MPLARHVFLALFALMFTACEPGGELAPPPAVPQVAASTGDASLHLTWQPVEGAQRYRVDVSGPPQEVGLGSYLVDDTNLVLDDLENGRKYDVSVTALGTGGASAAYNVSLTPQRVPEAPQELDIVSRSGRATLSWRQVPEASGYNVYFAPTHELPPGDNGRRSPSLFTRERVLNPHVETILENGTEYVFFVTAFNSSGESEFSTQLTATPGPLRGLTAGNAHTCVIDEFDALKCWGSNSSNQLGELAARAIAKPERVANDAQWKLAALGWEQTCAVSLDDTLLCWGAGNSGPTVITVGAAAPATGGASTSNDPPGGASERWRQISTAGSSACGTRSDGSLWCWGVANAMYAQEPEPLRRVGFGVDWLEVSNSDWHKCAIKRDRSLWCWGENYIGQLGDGTTEYRRLPTIVAPDKKWTTVTTSIGLGQSTPVGGPTPGPPPAPPPGPSSSGALGHTCAIADDARLLCWGVNQTGQLGEGTFNESWSPVEVSGGGAWRAVDAGTEHTCGIQIDGSLWCWGSNDFGQLGAKTPQEQPVPWRVSDEVDWVEVAAGQFHTCALRRDGSVWCAGRNDLGQLGLGGIAYQTEPALVLGDSRLVTATDVGTCAIRQDDSLWCWGVTASRFVERSLLGSQIGLERLDSKQQPTRVELAPGVQLIAVSGTPGAFGAGGAYCGLDQQGVIWCQDFPTLGPVTFSRVDGEQRWKSLSLGNRYSCGIAQDRTLHCWGADFMSGYLGAGQIRSDQPRVMSGSPTWTELAVSINHACAINTGLELWCWGANYSGELGQDPTTFTDIPYLMHAAPEFAWRSVTVGVSHSCALTPDDSLWCWGNNQRGQLGIDNDTQYDWTPQRVGDLGEWVSVSAGNDSTCAIKRDSSLWCWGLVGEASVVTRAPVRIGTKTGWLSVVTADARGCASHADGALYCWGRNEFGQAGNGSAWSSSWRLVQIDGR